MEEGTANHDPESESDRYERPLRLNDGQIEITLPAELADRDELENGQPFEFVPRLDKQSIVLDVATTDAEGRHIRRLRRAGEWGQSYLRFPKELVYALGWQNMLDAPDVSPTVAIDRVDSGEYTLRTWPATKPWFADTTEEAAESFTTRLVEVDSGPNTEYTQYRLGLPGDVIEAYSLEPGDKFAARLTARGGELVLAYDRDVAAHEADAPHTRTVFRSGSTPSDSGGYEREQFAVTVSKALVDVLDLASEDITVVPEAGQLLLQRGRA